VLAAGHRPTHEGEVSEPIGNKRFGGIGELGRHQRLRHRFGVEGFRGMDRGSGALGHNADAEQCGDSNAGKVELPHLAPP